MKEASWIDEALKEARERRKEYPRELLVGPAPSDVVAARDSWYRSPQSKESTKSISDKKDGSDSK